MSFRDASWFQVSSPAVAPLWWGHWRWINFYFNATNEISHWPAVSTIFTTTLTTLAMPAVHVNLGQLACQQTIACTQVLVCNNMPIDAWWCWSRLHGDTLEIHDCSYWHASTAGTVTVAVNTAQLQLVYSQAEYTEDLAVQWEHGQSVCVPDVNKQNANGC